MIKTVITGMVTSMNKNRPARFGGQGLVNDLEEPSAGRTVDRYVQYTVPKQIMQVKTIQLAEIRDV